MKSIKGVFLLFFLLSGALAFGQSSKKLIKEGDKAYRDGYKDAALEFYLKAHKRDPENVNLNFQIGKVYLETSYKSKSLEYLKKAYSIKPDITNLSYMLGRSYHFNNLFEEAIQYYEAAKEDNKNPDKVKDIERKIYECQNGKEFIANPVDVKILNLGFDINSEETDYAPIVSADESILIFTSQREGSTGGEFNYYGKYYEDIYISEKKNGEWSKPRNIGPVINTNSNESAIGLSPDGKELFIYKDEEGSGDIFSCKIKKDGTWTRPDALKINSKEYFEESATVTPDGKKLFFTSNREGGFGGVDIYMVEKGENGKWGEPKNLGPEVNTEGEEEAPFLDLDGKTLYFSSNRHKGMGGFDIFKTAYDSTTGKYSKPENLGYPINSADEDLYFTLSGDGRHGYYSSVKGDGMGGNDLYRIIMPKRDDYEELVTKVEAISGKTLVREKEDNLKEVKEEVVLAPVMIKGTVTDAVTNKPLQVQLEILDKNDAVVYTVKTGADGKYEFEVPVKEAAAFTISAEKNEYGFSSRKVSTPAPAKEKGLVIADLSLKKLDVGSKFVLRNIYFDFDKATIKKASNPELQKLVNMLNNNPDLKIEIGGHTDFIGSDAYNKDLSQRRADAVVKYLVDKGIKATRLTSVGYGEEKPLASNDDEVEGRELNRRTEFEVKENR